jgi:hypothetical protein
VKSTKAKLHMSRASESDKHPDICPVCCQFYPKTGDIYCSAQCRGLGHVFRRRLDPVCVRLHNLSFHMKWVNGVQLETTLPQAIQRFYPPALKTLCWPHRCDDITRLPSSDYWLFLERNLGKQVTSYVFALSNDPILWRVPPRMTLVPFCKSLLNSSDYAFTCPNCHKTYLRSEESCAADDGKCYDCSVRSIPF